MYLSSQDQDFLTKPFPCLQCGRSYKNKGSLKRHLQDECGKLPQYICNICNRGFKQKANFQRHKSTIHESGNSEIGSTQTRLSSTQTASPPSNTSSATPPSNTSSATPRLATRAWQRRVCITALSSVVTIHRPD